MRDWAHQVLKQLPPPQTPASLTSGVFAELEARAQRPWWKRSWAEWPTLPRVAWAVLALTAMGLISEGAFWLNDRLQPYADQATTHATMFTDHAQEWIEYFSSLTPDVFGQPFLHYGLPVAAVSYLLCLGLGTALVRIVHQHPIYRS